MKSHRTVDNLVDLDYGMQMSFFRICLHGRPVNSFKPGFVLAEEVPTLAPISVWPRPRSRLRPTVVPRTQQLEPIERMEVTTVKYTR